MPLLLDLFITFFKIGLFTFGGGYAMIPMIREEVVNHGWLMQEELVNFIAISESTPGPFAINIATYVGKVTLGIPGSIMCTLGVVLPSFIVILIVARIYDRFRKSTLVSGMMKGLKPAVVGLIAAAMLSIGQTVFFPSGIALSVLGTPAFLVSLGIFALAVTGSFKKVHPILLILGSAALGILAGLLIPGLTV